LSYDIQFKHAGTKSPTINSIPEHSTSYAAPQFRAVHHTDSKSSPILWYVPHQLPFSLFYVLLTVHPCIILSTEPTWCTNFLNVYWFSVHVSGNYVPIIRRKYRTCATSGICRSI